MNPPRHHPEEELLAAYAAGTGALRHDLVIATHMALCPECRRRVAQFEAIGGHLLDQMNPGQNPGQVPILPHALSTPPASGDRGGASRSGNRYLSPISPVLPEPLRSYVGGDVDVLPWKRRMPGVLEIDLDLAEPDAPARLVCLSPFVSIPRHDHTQGELTLVLAGGLRDADGVYERGDVSTGRPGHEHAQRVLAGEPCYALAINDGPLVPRTLLGRILARVTGL